MDEDKFRYLPTPDSFHAFYRRIAPMIDRTAAGEGETMRVAFDLPKEWIYLAVWLEQLRKTRTAGGTDPVVPDDFDVWRKLTRIVARKYIREMIEAHFSAELEHLISSSSFGTVQN